MTSLMYRFVDVAYAAMADPETGESRGLGTVEVELRHYPVIKKTPKGVWIDLGFGDRRFVLTNARRRFAHETVEAARASFIARKKRQISIYRARIARAEHALRAIERERHQARVLDAFLGGVS